MAKKKITAEIEQPNGEVKVEEFPETATMRVEIKKVPIEKARVRIEGDSPLLVHAWSQKAKKQLLESQQMTRQQKKNKEHEMRDPFADFVEAGYWVTPMPEVRGLPEKEQHARFEKAIEDLQYGTDPEYEADVPAVPCERCQRHACWFFSGTGNS